VTRPHVGRGTSTSSRSTRASSAELSKRPSARPFRRETTSTLARQAGATVGVNGGYFVLDPASGAPGDPAGIGVYDGRFLSEPINDRPALVLRDDARRTAVRRFTWTGRIRLHGAELRLDGLDRVPNLIRNCGGDSTDQPTARPLHDTTCTDDSELVAFTSEFGPTTPSGPGREIVIDAHRVIRAARAVRGTSLPSGWMSVQATGALADQLTTARAGDRVRLTLRPQIQGAPPRHLTNHTTVVNGGPLLLRNGREFITQRRDGFVHADGSATPEPSPASTRRVAPCSSQWTAAPPKIWA
jgi:hypothetical protein